MKAADSVRVTHYAEIDPKYESKKVVALCGHRVPKDETIADKDAVSCFLCWNRLKASSRTE